MSWNPEYVVLIFITTMVSYCAGIAMEKYSKKEQKKIILLSAFLICIGILFFFKYFNFFSESAIVLLKVFSIQLHPVTLNLLLPVGISFYTFQTLSYVIDIYKGDVVAEWHFGKYATFISFFPQLVAGPIERTDNLLPQIKAELSFDYKQATYGIKLMTWGYFKKMVIADTISMYIGKVFEIISDYHGFSLVIAAFLFTFQIYCDFSGYSDIAIGTAKLMGINLMANFKSPYLSQSIREFWSRWHISLSTWLKDYIYIPLGGNRVSKLKTNFNLMVTFLVSGLWHGANWTFVIWGVIHGVAQVIENQFECLKIKSHGVKRVIRVLCVFIFCSIAWVFFASPDISSAFYLFTHFLDGISSPISYLHDGFSILGIGKCRLAILAFCLFLLFIFDLCSLKTDCIELISRQNRLIRNMVYLFLVCLVTLLRASRPAEFVYFQF